MPLKLLQSWFAWRRPRGGQQKRESLLWSLRAALSLPVTLLGLRRVLALPAPACR